MANALLLENWTVQTHAETEDAIAFTASYDLVPDACPKCGSVGAKFYRHGAVVSRYVDAPHFGKKCTIEAKTRRLRCLECSGTFMQMLPDMADGYMMTKRRGISDECSSAPRGPIPVVWREAHHCG
jgi:transposase